MRNVLCAFVTIKYLCIADNVFAQFMQAAAIYGGVCQI